MASNCLYPPRSYQGDCTRVGLGFSSEEFGELSRYLDAEKTRSQPAETEASVVIGHLIRGAKLATTFAPEMVWFVAGTLSVTTVYQLTGLVEGRTELRRAARCNGTNKDYNERNDRSISHRHECTDPSRKSIDPPPDPPSKPPSNPWGHSLTDPPPMYYSSTAVRTAFTLQLDTRAAPCSCGRSRIDQPPQEQTYK